MSDPAGKVVDTTIVTAEARAALQRLRELAAELVAIVNDPDAGDEAADAAGRLLVEIGPAAVEPLVEYVCQDPKGGREAATAILVEIGEPAVGPLLICFEHDDPDVRATAAFLFTALRDHGNAAEQPLIRLLDDPDELVRQSAAYALGAHDSRRAVPKLVALATRPVQMPSREAEPEAWAEAYPYDSCAAVDALGQLGDPRAVQPLIFLIETQGADGPMYDEAVRALGLLGDYRGAQVVRQAFESARFDGVFADALAAMFGRGALEELLELAESGDAATRRAVCEDLIRLASPVAAESVAALLVDLDEEVRAAARDALGQTVDAATLEEIVTGLEDPAAKVRAWTTNLLPLSCAWSD
ncbi:MAG TPA: HEAT repeat domain-containing protein [Thermoleophilia bacterium]